MEFIIIFIILCGIVILVITNKTTGLKNKTVKKDEIFIQYKNDLRALLEKHKDNKSLQVEQKKLFLQKCNSELSRNIFFTEAEAIQILQKLSKL